MTILKRLARFIGMKYRFRFMGRRGLARYYQRRLRKVCSYGAGNSTYFQRYFEGLTPRRITPLQLDHLPPINKQIMMDNFDEYNTKGLRRDELIEFAQANDRDRTYDRYFDDAYSVGLSSGTSGSVGLAIYSKQEVTDSIFKFLARNGMPAGLKKHNIMFALRTSVPAFGEVNRFGYKVIHYNYDTPVAEVIEGINRQELNILAGSPTFLLQLAPFAGKIDHNIDAVISYAEILEGHVRKELEGAFAIRVRELYSATECYLAASCRLGSLHLNEDLVYIKLTSLPDRENVFSMTVTDLYRTTQPIINYRLNDLVELDDRPCRCGSSFRVVKQVIGRADDYLLVSQDGGGRSVVYADYVRRAIIAAATGMSEYRVTQDAINHINVELEFYDLEDHREVCKDVVNTLVALFEKYTDTPPSIEVAARPEIAFPNDLKRKRVLREISDA